MGHSGAAVAELGAEQMNPTGVSPSRGGVPIRGKRSPRGTGDRSLAGRAVRALATRSEMELCRDETTIDSIRRGRAPRGKVVCELPRELSPAAHGWIAGLASARDRRAAPELAAARLQSVTDKETDEYLVGSGCGPTTEARKSNLDIARPCHDGAWPTEEAATNSPLQRPRRSSPGRVWR
jgi:hypothetical protein